MPKGVRGSGRTRERMLSPEEARTERARLQEQLQRIEAQDTQRYAIIGRVVALQAETDDEFAKQLHELLDRNVKDRGERMCIGLTTTRRGRRRASTEAPTAEGAEPTRMTEALP